MVLYLAFCHSARQCSALEKELFCAPVWLNGCAARAGSSASYRSPHKLLESLLVIGWDEHSICAGDRQTQEV